MQNFVAFSEYLNFTWKSRDNTGAFMQEGLFKKDFTPLRVIQKSKLVSQPKGSFIGATPRADVLLLFQPIFTWNVIQIFHPKKTFQPFYFWEFIGTRYGLPNDVQWKKITTILLINFSIAFKKVSFVAFCLSLCFHNILYFIVKSVNHYLQYFFPRQCHSDFCRNSYYFQKENFWFISQNLLEYDIKWHTLESIYDLYLKAIHIQT